VELEGAHEDAEHVCDAVLRAAGSSRFALCRLGPSRLAMFRREQRPGAATATLLRALDEIRRLSGIRAVGWLSLEDDGLPHLDDRDALHLTQGALDRANASAAGTIARVVLRREAPSVPHPG
jgi:hypothetical protein